MKMMVISALYPPYIMGGAERSAASLAEGLAERGHEITVITLTPADMPVPTKVENGITIHYLPLHNSYWPYNVPKQEKADSKWQRLLWHVRDINNGSMVKQVMAIADAVQPQVVLTHNLQGFSTGIWPALQAKNIPILHTLHDYALICPRTSLFKNGKNCGLNNARCTDCTLLTMPRQAHTKAIAAVVGVSQATLNMHYEHGLFADIPAKAILNSVRVGVYPKARTRDTKDARVSFGFLGRVDAPKGFETLLQALSGLPKDQARLVVAGKAEDAFLAQMQQMYDLSNVEFLGFCQPQDLFNQIDVLTFPSIWKEPLGNGVFEAYFQGLPVIGSDKGGIPEMIDEGKTGFVFPAGDAEALRKLMQTFINQPNLGAAMQADILEKAQYFLPKRRLDDYESLIQSIAIE